MRLQGFKTSKLPGRVEAIVRRVVKMSQIEQKCEQGFFGAVKFVDSVWLDPDLYAGQLGAHNLLDTETWPTHTHKLTIVVVVAQVRRLLFTCDYRDDYVYMLLPIAGRLASQQLAT